MRRIFQILVVLLTIFLYAIAMVCGGDVPMSDQKLVYDCLLTISSIVFGVMGAWIAIVYPQGLQEILARREPDKHVYASAKRTFVPMKISTAIVTLVLLFELLYPVLKSINWLREYRPEYRAMSFVILVTLVLLQIGSIVYSLLPMDQAEEDLDKAEAHNNSLKRRKGKAELVRREKSPKPTPNGSNSESLRDT